MLVESYPEYSSDLSDFFNTELFNPSDFTIDSALPDYTDSFPLNDLLATSPFLDLNPTISPAAIGIDPQLVDTPSAITDHGDDDDSDSDPTSKLATITPPATSTKSTHKSRKGAVFSGGIVKKPSLPISTSIKEKENTALALVSSGVAAAKKAKHARNPSSVASPTSSSTFGGLSAISEDRSSFSARRLPSESSGDVDDDDDHELMQDWRPAPDILAKMTSKEKRQLRNKISARNFRVRRKEYISTLEGDIAARDRLLDHFRTQLGTRESENLALRQEIDALKKALLEGRGIDPSVLSSTDGSEQGMVIEDGGVNLHLPPPKMLPAQSAAEALMLAEAEASHIPTTGLLTANTQKDLPISRNGSSSTAFWGGVSGGMGGITPVHTTLVPDTSAGVRRALMENMNPSLNGQGQQSLPSQRNQGFDLFADAHLFTLKSMDVYRMQLWAEKASQNAPRLQPHNPPSPSSSTTTPSPPASPYYSSNGGLSDRLRPLFFSSPSSFGLSGKHSPPSSPLVAHKVAGGSSVKETVTQQQQQKVLIAAMASQTLAQKLGNAFWDAFVGSSSSPSTTLSSGHAHGFNASVGTGHRGNWDSDKVQRVLEGKAVLKVVDVDALPSASVSAAVPMTTGTTASERCCELLEESMRSLTIGKKA